MTPQDFKAEIDKLIVRFDKKYYPPEVMDVLWKEVGQLHLFWFKGFIAKAMGQHRPPLLPEFKEACKIEKDRLRMKPSLADTYDPHSIFTMEQRKFLFRLVGKAATRSIPTQTIENVIVPVLSDIVQRKDQRSAHNFFKELSQEYSIPYDDGPGAA